MNQDEVNLIYNYLHENYEYRDGELIKTKNGPGYKVGHKLGSIETNSSGQLKIMVQIKINNKKYSRGLHQFVFLFHNKRLPRYVRHIDGNYSNNKIENLIEEQGALKNNIKRNNLGYKKDNRGFRVNLTWNKIKKTYGCYVNEKIAAEVYEHVKNLRYTQLMNHEEIKLKVKEKFGKHTIASSLNPKGWKFQDNLYQVRLRKNGKQHHIGSYKTPEEAHEAYLKAKEEYKNG